MSIERAMRLATMDITPPVEYTLKSEFPILIGTKYGKWTVTGKTRKVIKNAKPVPHVPVRCDCGFKTTVHYFGLKNRKTNQCITCANIERNQNRK